jgi:hypothetical protein
MPITQQAVYSASGIPEIEITVPFKIPQQVDSGETGMPRTAHLEVDVADTGGALVGEKLLYYTFVAIDAAAGRSTPSWPIEARLPAGSSNVVTISGETPFDAGAVEFEVYRSEHSPRAPRRVYGPAAIPVPFEFVDDGLAAENILPPDNSYTATRVYWRRVGETFWTLGAETEDKEQTTLKFTVPFNINGQDIEIQLRAVGRSGRETPETVAPTSSVAIIGARRAVIVIAQDAPENRCWNAHFQGTAGALTGQPTAPTGYAIWADGKTEGSAPAFTGTGELNLQNCTTAGGINGVRQDIDWNFLGYPGEDVVIQVQVKKKSSTVPNGDFRMRLVGWDGSAETGTARVLDNAGSIFDDAQWALLTFRTTLPADVTAQTHWRVELLNAGSTNESFKVRRAMVNRGVDPPRWNNNVPREPVTQFVAGGGAGGGEGGGDPGGPPGPGGDDPPIFD